MTERSSLVEIETGQDVLAMAFSADGEHLVTGGREDVRVWRVQDGVQTATMRSTGAVNCLAVAKDGRWMAAGTAVGEVMVWNTKTYQQTGVHKQDDFAEILDVDFSPDATRLVVAPGNCTAVIWDVVGRERVFTLDDDYLVKAAKYAPQGDRIATATGKSVRIWDGNDGRLLFKISVETVTARHSHTGLLWFGGNKLFVVSDNKIIEIDTSTRSVLSEWPVSIKNSVSGIALPQHGNFIARSGRNTITFWDTSTHTQLCLVSEQQNICSIALSLDLPLLAIAVQDAKVIIKSLSNVIDWISPPLLHPTFRELEIHIDIAALDLWKRGRLTDADELLTATISNAHSQRHHAFASRALIRARLAQLDAAIDDAEESVKIQPSLLGYIAKFSVLTAMGQMRAGTRACDIAFEYYHSTHVTTILLIKAVILFMAGEHEDAISRVDDLIAKVDYNSYFYVVQTYMYLHLGNVNLENKNYEQALQLLESAKTRLRNCETRFLSVISLISGWKFNGLGVAVQRHLCEALYQAGRIKDVAEALLETIETFSEDTSTTEWVTDFIRRCLSNLQYNGDEIWYTSECELATRHSSSPITMLTTWTRLKLTGSSWEDVLADASVLTTPKFVIYPIICERLESIDLVADAIACFHQMNRECSKKLQDEGTKWSEDFKSRCLWRVAESGNAEMDGGRYDAAISYFTLALSLNPTTPSDLFVQRSRAYAGGGLWEDALNDANEIIKLDPSSPLGYESQYAALHGSKCYHRAADVFEMMMSKMSQSSDPEVRAQSLRYVQPARTKEAIRTAVEKTIRDSPPVLINTHSGQLLDKSSQAFAFESTLIFWELMSSTTTTLDQARIDREVARYYRYTTFSHKWEDDEPLFEMVTGTAIFELGDSPAHEKLKMFCKTAREAGFHWAWSDTCCINKGDHVVLQEALVSMFRWYQNSAMTVVFLRGVHRLSERGALARSIWNTRAWTFQEYHASKVVRFYTEDWTPYLNLDVDNHKNAPEIVVEMEDATGVSSQVLRTLQPGLDDIREKLRLSSMRQTTRVEDTAYALFGMFSVSLPVVYGEGDKALGRLLAQILASSGDSSILAWTGQSGTFNSCLPRHINVFSRPLRAHIPVSMRGESLEVTATKPRAPSIDMTLAGELYDALSELPVPSFAGQRMRLPCIAFKLGPLSTTGNEKGHVHRAQTVALGVVEISTEEDLSGIDSLYLVHPWIEFLLDRHPVWDKTGTAPSSAWGDLPTLLEHSKTSSSKGSRIRESRFVPRLGWPFGGRSIVSSSLDAVPNRDSVSLLAPSSISPMEKQMRALELVCRLRQPFGALLFTRTRQNMEEYKRVAADSLITVQIKEMTPVVLGKLIRSVGMLDVL